VVSSNVEDELAGGGESSSSTISAPALASPAMSRAERQAKLLDVLLRVTLVKGASTITETQDDLSGKACVGLDAPRTECRNCGNKDESHFSSDYKSGDTVCTRCGLVVSQNYIFEGDWTRSFDDEKSTTQLGPASNPLLSCRANLGTSFKLSEGVSKAKIKRLNEVAKRAAKGIDAVEGSSERRTTLAYKDAMKKKAWDAMERAALKLNLSAFVVNKAKEIFSLYRDNREALHDYELSIAASLVASLEEDEFLRLKREEEGVGSEDGEGENGPDGEFEGGDDEMDSNGGSLLAAEPVKTLSPEELKAREKSLAEKEAREKVRDRALGIIGFSRMIDSSKGPAGDESSDEDDEDEPSAVGKKPCPGKNCSGTLSHLRNHGPHDLLCTKCDAHVCYVCLLVWKPYLPRCSCTNACHSACPHCPDCPQYLLRSKSEPCTIENCRAYRT